MKTILPKPLGTACLTFTLGLGAAQAASIDWLGTTSNDWGTSTNWTPAGTPTTTSGVVINNNTNNPVELNASTSLNGTTGSLAVGNGAGSGDSLNINSGVTLTMGARPITLNGGSITSTGGVISGTGTVTGFGTFSAPYGGTHTFTGNGTAGNPLILDGGNNYSGTFSSSTTGGVQFQSGSVFIGSTGGSGGTFNLNGATWGNGTTGMTLGCVSCQVSVSAASTLNGPLSYNQYSTISILSGVTFTDTGAGNISTVTGGLNPFAISGTFNYSGAGASSMSGGGTVGMTGGTITNTGGGLFTIGDPISGYGTVSGNIALNAGNETVTGGNMTWNGVTIGSTGSGPGVSVNGNVLNLQGNITVPSSFNVNPGAGGMVQLDNTTISGATATGHNVNNSGLTTAGTFNVSNASTLNNINFSTGNGANMTVNAPLTLSGSSTLDTTSLTLGANSGLSAAGAANTVNVRGNFVNQSMNPSSWNNGVTAGLGPNLLMSSPTGHLEVGGVDMGYTPLGFSGNFALDSLTLTALTASTTLVDNYQNATTGSWTSGTEALYLDGLFGSAGSSSTAAPILNLDGLDAYLNGYGQLQDGFFQATNGTWVDIVGAPSAVPGPVAGSGLPGVVIACVGLVALGRRRKGQNI
jgi:fibronectin-binding autotransporter adhesin